MTITHAEQVTETSLIDPDLRAQLIADVRSGWPDLTDDMGERGVNQMVAFLATGARTTEVLTPSRRVDEFWHRFILRTREYAAFCEALGAGFIHHVPEPAGQVAPVGGRAAMERTTTAIAAAGFVLDAEFWPGPATAECHQCHAGCADSPVGK
ncbi:hypothetical protein FNQ90_02840 [Streptomyces alkaliphilus]|uniref:Uncharacterized protein n=1 Tax=Streptomyces alkaliphilus TaxID=1472722 RepID=A0A7W3Y090_9ACTN|nr:hypothetical protein [Streptomyces alkaliphilus]MBB0243072.1 hypothetical protein [Streptomyces alkaliphilus]